MNFNLRFPLAITACLVAGTASVCLRAESVSSPDSRIVVTIETGPELSYSVSVDSTTVLAPSPLRLVLDDGRELGRNSSLARTERNSINEEITPVLPEKRSRIHNQANELTLFFDGDFGVIFRACNDGVAYRFFTSMKGQIRVRNEDVAFRFPKDYLVYIPLTESFQTSFENSYTKVNASALKPDQIGFLPVLAEAPGGPKILISEADLDDYPGMFITGSADGTAQLRGRFAAYPLKEEQKRDRTLAVTERADYIAETTGTRDFPWRALLIARQDTELVESDFMFRLAPAQKLQDTSWIRPGKLAWDWWNANNVYGVDFKSGINTETYKYYIDFAAQYGIEYMAFDEGWSDTTDLLKVNPDLDMPGLIRYARQKGVGVILWCVWLTLDRQMGPALDAFQKWGVSGVKVDFMDRDDQKIVNFYHRLAAEAGRRKLLVDFHGAYKPTGLRRAYPNVITREAVMGLEYSKWSDRVTPEYDVTLPFIRMAAGPMDFTPGAMNNAQKRDFRAIFERPMSQGTRLHQLAMYVVYESPLQMLSDSPSNYYRESDMMDFLSKVPSTWDETRVLQGKVAEYVLVARRKGNAWFVGGMNGESARKLDVDLSFLPAGNYTADIYMDGINADRWATDYRRVSEEVTSRSVLKAAMAPGGGWVGRITAR